MKTIGEKIRECRARLDMTQAELSSKTGLTIRTVSKYETDAVTPRGTNLHKLATALGVSEAYLTNPNIDWTRHRISKLLGSNTGRKGPMTWRSCFPAYRPCLLGAIFPKRIRISSSKLSCRRTWSVKKKPGTNLHRRSTASDPHLGSIYRCSTDYGTADLLLCPYSGKLTYCELR